MLLNISRFLPRLRNINHPATSLVYFPIILEKKLYYIKLAKQKQLLLDLRNNFTSDAATGGVL